MKQTLTIALCLIALAGIVSAGWVDIYTKSIGNVTGNIIRGTAADTVYWTGTHLAGMQYLALDVRADSVVDSLPKFLKAVKYKYTGAGSWTALAWGVGAGANDSTMPLDGWAGFDTLTTPGLTSYYATLLGKVTDSLMVIITGKRASQCSKNDSVRIRVLK
jgi:hypothetical protein